MHTAYNRIPRGVALKPDHPEAGFLAATWKGCTQAVTHPTQDTNHPDIGVATIDRAMRIIIPHLDATIYRAANLSVLGCMCL